MVHIRSVVTLMLRCELKCLRDDDFISEGPDVLLSPWWVSWVCFVYPAPGDMGASTCSFPAVCDTWQTWQMSHDKLDMTWLKFMRRLPCHVWSCQPLTDCLPLSRWVWLQLRCCLPPGALNNKSETQTELSYYSSFKLSFFWGPRNKMIT